MSKPTILQEIDSKFSPEQQLSRRQILRLLAGGALTTVLAACGDATPTPTPTRTPPISPLFPTFTSTPVPSSRVYLPFVQNDTAVVAPLSPLETPTETPTPPPTEPPPPPPTPTPQATEFPPGPPSKLGLFVTRNDPQIFDLVRTKAVTVVKTLELDANFVAEIKTLSPRTLVIARLPGLADVDIGSLDPLPAARQFVDQLLPIADDPARRPWIDGWEAYNEPAIHSLDAMKRIGDFEAERTRLLGELGIRSVVGNFATGNPGDLALWPAFFPALQAVKQYNGWLGLHEYGAPTIYFMTTRDNQGRYPGISPQDLGWHALRYRRVYNDILKPAGLAVPLIFTELGVDGLVGNDRPGPSEARGWRDFEQYWRDHGYGEWGPGAYIEQLVWYDQAMQQDAYVVGGCIFALAASVGWGQYEISGEATRVLQQYLSVHTPG